jgi:hypothetical protein
MRTMEEIKEDVKLRKRKIKKEKRTQYSMLFFSATSVCMSLLYIAGYDSIQSPDLARRITYVVCIIACFCFPANLLITYWTLRIRIREDEMIIRDMEKVYYGESNL